MTAPRKTPLLVTSPLLPDLEEFQAEPRWIRDSHRLTNNATYHQRSGRELTRFLGVPYLSLFTNGTLPLITVLQALRCKFQV